jgi:hypothetical protein
MRCSCAFTRKAQFVPSGPFDLVVHRTERDRKPLFLWKLAVEKFGKRAAFVGLAREDLDFVSQHGSVFLRPTRDLLELASVIAGSRLFAGNQSVGHALAESRWPGLPAFWTRPPGRRSAIASMFRPMKYARCTPLLQEWPTGRRRSKPAANRQESDKWIRPRLPEVESGPLVIWTEDG